MATQPKPVKRDPRCANGRVYIHGGYTEVGKKADGTEYQKSVHTSSSKTLECRPEDAICVDDYKSACTKDRTVIYSQPFCMSTSVVDLREYLKRSFFHEYLSKIPTRPFGDRRFFIPKSSKK